MIRKLAQGCGPVDAAPKPNDRWSLDFVHDRLRTNRRYRILGVGDYCTRENTALEAAFAISSQRMTRVLDDIAIERGYPKTIVLTTGQRCAALRCSRGRKIATSACISFSPEASVEKLHRETGFMEGIDVRIRIRSGPDAHPAC